MHSQADASFIINFDTPGYTAGTNLQGSTQPTGTVWSGGTSDFVITAGAGVGGSNAVVTSSRASSSAASVMIPTYTENGDLPGFNGSSSLVNASFAFRFVDAPSETSTDGILAVQLGFNSGIVAVGAVRLGVRADGSLTYSDGSSSSRLISGFTVTDTTSWHTFEAELNYETATYRFRLNEGDWSDSYAFQISGDFDPTQVINPRIQNVGSANHRRIAIDNFQYTVIPEPSSVALLMGIMALFLARYFRQSRAR